MNAAELEQLADSILLKIRMNQPKPVSSKSLTKDFKISQVELTAALKQIDCWGYRLKKDKANKVTFIAPPDSVTATEISYQLRTKTIARKIIAYRSVKSTNVIAARLAEAGESEGTIVTAEEQTKGKGRLGRKWHSPHKAGLYLSIILKPKFKPELAPGVSIMTALALADAVNEHCRGEVQIKWPNDILISGKKIAGILTELSAEKGKINYIIVGIGINVNHRVDDFPDVLKNTATSIRIVNRKKADRIGLLKQFLTNFEKEYARYKKNHLVTSRKKIRKYSSLIGSMVKLKIGKNITEGRAVDIDSFGALIIEKDGKRTALSSGEVTVVKE